MHRIILGSTSPYRRKLLQRLGLPFEIQAPQADEDVAKRELLKKGLPPLEIARELARLKAESLRSPDALVIGGDQLVHLDGEIFGKPGTSSLAQKQLADLQGRTHEIITAVCLCLPQQIIEFQDVARLKMKSLSSREISNYVDQDLPLDCAGSYKIEKNGHLLFDQIQCEDLSAIEGLPLLRLAKVLQTLGYETQKT
jgi:septum formation protein